MWIFYYKLGGAVGLGDTYNLDRVSRKVTGKPSKFTPNFFLLMG